MKMKETTLEICNKIYELILSEPPGEPYYHVKDFYVTIASYQLFFKQIDLLKDQYDELETLSVYIFRDELINYLNSSNKAGTLNDLNNLNNLKIIIEEIIKKYPPGIYKVIAPLFGCYLSESIIQLPLGEFKIYSKRYNQSHQDEFYDGPPFECFISVQINALDNDFAGEMANQKFKNFQFALKFVLASNDLNNHISTEEAKFAEELRYFENSPRGILSSRNRKYITNESLFDLNVNIISESFVWDILSNPRSDFQKRLKNSIIWAGKALMEKDETISFIQYFFALEALLQKDSNFGPSISHQIAESIAFKLNTNRDERKDTYQKVKKLYVIRSKIAHGEEVKKEELNTSEIKKICLQIITILLGEKEKFKKFDDFENHIKDLRFS